MKQRGSNMTSFINHIDISSKEAEEEFNKNVPFEVYLFVGQDYGHIQNVYELSKDAPLDLKDLLTELFDLLYEHETSIETYTQMGGSNYACIKTDHRTTDSPIVWSFCDFHIDY